MAELTEQQWQAEMRHALWTEQDCNQRYRAAIAYRERMRVTGELKGWVEE